MTFHFELSRQPNKQGNHTIFLQVFHKVQRKRYKTSVVIQDKHWDAEKGKPPKNCIF